MGRLLSRILLVVAVASLIAPSNSYGQRTIFVNQSATGLNDGTSWTNAFASLQDAIAASASGDEIWVAAGTYHPDEGAGITPGDREASFFLKEGVSHYGGFTGVETSREQRDWEGNETILSGDLQKNDSIVFDADSPTRLDNSFHVSVINNSNDVLSVVIDGFTISDGDANPSGSFGAGILIHDNARVELRNSLVLHNHASTCGGGIMSWGGSFSIEKSTFFENEQSGSMVSCGGGGGGALFEMPNALFRIDSSPSRIDHVTFESNFASRSGGAIASFLRPLHVTNSVFINNTGFSGGAASHLNVPASSPVMYENVLFLGNIAAHEVAGAIVLESSAGVIVNSVFSGNRVLPGAQPGLGGAMALIERRGSGIVINSTFFENEAPQSGAIWNSGLTTLEIHNSIIWGNTSGDGISIRSDGPELTPVGNSIVSGGLPFGFLDTGGVLDLDPGFVDAKGPDNIAGTADDNFRLWPGSPAIDVGDNEALPPDSLDLDEDGNLSELIPMDLNGNVRVFDGGTGSVTVDLGPYEFGAPPLIVAVEEPAVPRETGLTLSRPFPNPFSTATMITFSSKRGGHATLTVYDMLGRRVRVLFDGVLQPAQARNVTLEGKHLAPGAYVIQLQDGHQVSNQLIVRSRI